MLCIHLLVLVMLQCPLVSWMCTGAVSGMSLFNHTALIQSPSLRMRCCVPCSAQSLKTIAPACIPLEPRSTPRKRIHHISQWWSCQDSPRGHFPSVPSGILAFPGAHSYWCSRQCRVSEPGLTDRSPEPAVCTSHQKLHLSYLQLGRIAFWFPCYMNFFF